MKKLMMFLFLMMSVNTVFAAEVGENETDCFKGNDDQRVLQCISGSVSGNKCKVNINGKEEERVIDGKSVIR